MQRHDGMGVALAMAMLITGCTNDGDRTTDDAAGTTEAQTSSEPGSETTTTNTTTNTTAVTTNTTTNATGDPDSTGAADTTIAGTDDDTTTNESAGTTTDDTDGSGTTGSSFGMLPHEELFEGPQGAPWPLPWTPAGTAVVSATLDDGRGRLVGQTGSVARMTLPGFVETDVDVTVTVVFDDWTQQGFGLYVRQNGGALQETTPPGQGYAAYVEGGFMQSIGVWRETNGVEELLQAADVPGGELVAGMPYHLRLQCQQAGALTHLRTRIWPAGGPEPDTWQVDLVDDTPVLQGAAGSFALDVYNYAGMGGVLVDDLRVDSL
jgi:large repetitive protein